jgi:hypothetical protein
VVALAKLSAALTTAVTAPGIWLRADARVLELDSWLTRVSSIVSEFLTAFASRAKLVFTAETAVVPALTTFLTSDSLGDDAVLRAARHRPK